jgi:3-oxoacyl-[acyl-carrier protein] reductase
MPHLLPMTIDLTNKVVLITGGSQGIGAQTARKFHAAGATAVINYRGEAHTRADAEKLAGELNATRDGSALIAGANVAQAEAVRRMMEEIKGRCGGIDFLVNNAAINRDHSIAKMTLEEWDTVIAVNLSGVFNCCKFGTAIMRDEGAVVSLGSIAAIEGFFGTANYSAAKAGVSAMMRVLSREVARRGIRANVVAPGVIDTAMAASIPETIRADMLKRIPLGRFGLTDDVANAVLFLCSPLAAYITGQTIEVNGAWRG